jgi:hypothetical protein
MEKLQGLKQDVERDLESLEESGESHDLPVELKTYQEFLNAITNGMGSETDALFKQKVIQRLVHKIEILSEGLKIHWFSGEGQFIHFDFKREVKSAHSHKEIGGSLTASPNFFCLRQGSNTLTTGSGGRKGLIDFVSSRIILIF